MARAIAAGLTRILNPGIDLPSCRAAIQLANAHPQIYAAVGIHPNSANAWDKYTLGDLRRLARHPKVVAIGEIGLDYYWDRTPRDLQHKVLRAQLALAAELALPVIIHNRESTADVVAALLAWQAELSATQSPLAERPGVVHSFSGDEQSAQQLIASNFYIGITGPVTFKNARGLQQLVAGLPLERVLIETDAPFLAPHPKRGKRNEPAYVRRVAEKIAALQDIPLQAVVEKTAANAARLFRWGGAV